MDEVNEEQFELVDNTGASRFELHSGEDVAISVYRLKDDRIIFTHTEVPQHLEGRGIGSRLAKFALDSARERGLKVVPRCIFIADYIEHHPEYQELVLGDGSDD